MTGSKDTVKVAVYVRTDRSFDDVRREVTECIDMARSYVTEDLPPTEDLVDLVESENRTMITLHGEPFLAVAADTAGETTYADRVMNRISWSDTEHVVVPARRDPCISDVLETAVASGAAVHIAPAGLNAESSVADTIDRATGAGEEWSGRPPVGFRLRAGRLVRDDDFEDIVEVLRLVDRGELSKRAAADELDVSRRTVNRCLDRKDMYSLA